MIIIQKLRKEFTADETEMRRLQALQGDPKFTELKRAQERSEQMRQRGELRLLRRTNRAKFFERY